MTSNATDRVSGARSSLAIKAPCVAASTANLTLSGEQTVDGVACVTGDRVLVKNQTSGIDNGIYVVDTGTWNRSPDSDGANDLTKGTLVYVNGGTVGSGYWYCSTSGTIIVGMTSLSFGQASAVLAVVSAFMQGVNAAATASSAYALLAAGALAVTGDISPTALSANTDDWAPTGFSTASILRMDSTAAWNLTGIAAGSDGRLIYLQNISSFTVTLKNNVTSTAANRFLLSADYLLAANTGVVLEYDATSARWRIFGQQTATTVPIVNGLINGGHEIWQRGTNVAVAASNNGYGPDRWTLTTGANQACTLAQSTGLSSGSQWSGVVQRNAAQTGTGTLTYEQPFELSEIVKWRGKTISVSFVLATGATWSPAAGALALTLACGTGSAGRRATTPYTNETQPIAAALTAVANSGATTYTVTASAIVPTTCTQMTLQFSWAPTGMAGATDTLSVDDVMFSDTAGAAFERRPVQQELALCQRYFEKSFALATTPGQNAGAGTGEFKFPAGVAGANNEFATIPFKVSKRVAPSTVTFFNPAVANAQARDESASSDCSATAVNNATETSMAVVATGNAGTSAGNVLGVHWTASAEL